MTPTKPPKETSALLAATAMMMFRLFESVFIYPLAFFTVLLLFATDYDTVAAAAAIADLNLDSIAALWILVATVFLVLRLGFANSTHISSLSCPEYPVAQTAVFKPDSGETP